MNKRMMVGTLCGEAKIRTNFSWYIVYILMEYLVFDMKRLRINEFSDLN